MNITASDRSAMIRLASTLPKGSEERRDLLASLQKAGMEHSSPEALKKYLQDHPAADKSKHTVKKEDGGGGGEGGKARKVPGKALTMDSFKSKHGDQLRRMSDGAKGELSDLISKTQSGDVLKGLQGLDKALDDLKDKLSKAQKEKGSLSKKEVTDAMDTRQILEDFQRKYEDRAEKAGLVEWDDDTGGWKNT
jgi:hypothetical protein